MFKLQNRSVIKIWGRDAAKFLHNITTNDVMHMSELSTIYNLILNSKGRYLFDFFLVKCTTCFLLECEEAYLQPIVELIRLYRVHLNVKVKCCADYFVAIETTKRHAYAGNTSISDNGIVAFQDPRSVNMGMRYIVPTTAGSEIDMPTSRDIAEYNVLRISNTIPDCCIDMVSGESFPLYYRLDHLHAIDHTKGCYTGQEVVARMYRLGTKKMIYTVISTCCTKLPMKGPIRMDNLEVGSMLSTEGHIGLCILDTSQVSGNCKGLQIEGIDLELQRNFI